LIFLGSTAKKNTGLNFITMSELRTIREKTEKTGHAEAAIISNSELTRIRQAATISHST